MQTSSMSVPTSNTVPGLKRAHSITSLENMITDKIQYFETADKQEFNVHEFSRNVGRNNTLPFLTLYLLR